MAFGRNFCEERQIWVSEPHFRKVRGDARPWFIARWKAHSLLSIRINWTVFYYLLRFRSYEAKCVLLGFFCRGSTSLHSNFTWTGSSPIRKLETLDYPMVKTAPPALSRFDTIPECDGRTDGRICRRIYCACKASFVARCKISPSTSTTQNIRQ